ncbi:unnamed protein product [Chondrus crispus]|uniref:HEAT repeat-containing protein 1 n=1 Tax=Chondrus crispus TaxID=2769 RepID=R7QAF4_CHOCR|nr:unnamed protein product [Chondrus crispus]CDF34445.1 unnamed protein product [Chondrus crispus]|eukprot:XP_005714264.1 unnamed protein product [Chondrus crispus]
MSHPEHSVVKTALAKLVDSNYSWTEQEASVTESIVGRCNILLKGDSDAHVAADAALCLLQAKSEALPEHVLPSILSRLRSAYNLLRKKKKRKPSRISGLIALCNALLTGCERDTGTDPVKVQAMLIGLIRDGVFSNNSVVSHDEETFKRLATLLSQETEIRCLDSAELGDGQLREVVEAALRSKIASRTYKFDALVESMSEWDPSWALELLAFCVHQGDKKALKKFAEFRAAGVVESLVKLYEDHESIRAKILEEAVNAIGPIHDALGSQFSQSRVVDRIWNLAARLENEKIAQQVLAKVHGYCGFVKVKNMLQSASAVTSVSGGRIQFYSLQWFLISCESDSSNEVNQEAMLCLFGALYGNDNQARDKLLALCAAKAAVHNSTLPKSPLISFYCAIANYHASVAIPLTSESTLEQLDNFLSGALLNYRSRLGFIAPLAALEGLEEKSAVIRLASSKIVDQEYDPLQRLYFLRALEGYSGYEETEVLSLFRMEINLLSKLLGDTDRSSVTCESLVRVAQILGTMKTHSLSREVIIDAAEETASLLQALDKKRPLLSGEVNLAVIAGFSQLFSICNCRELDITQDLLRHMLSFSTRASTAGSVARQTLDSTVLNDKLNNLLPFLQRLGTKERAPDAMDVQVDDGVRPSTLDQEAGMGAVDTIKRWLLTDKMIDRPFKFDVTSVLSSLWSFVRAVTSESSLMRNAGDRNEYQLCNVLDLIEQILHRERERNMQDTAVDLDALMKTVFYPHVSHEGNESALMRSVRCQALQVAMVLAPRCGNELASRLCDVLSAQMEDVSFSKQLKSVHRLAAVLLKSGCDPRVVCNFLVRAAYKKIGNTVASEEDRELIVSCCRLMPDMEEALLCCLQQICKESADYLEVKSIARECSRLLLGAEQSLIMDLSVIARVGSDIRCELALVHVVGPLFRKKLTEAVQSATSDASVIEGISNLLKSLWVLNRNIADRPVTALVSFLPLRAISLCLGNIISTENVAIRIRAVKTLSGRMLDDASLLYGWHENDQKLPDYVDLKSSQTAFVEELGSILSAVISEFGDKDHVKINELGAELKLCSLSCIQNIADRIGSSAPQVLLQLSTTPLQVLRASSKFLDKPEEIVNGQWQSDVAVAMDCLSSIVTVIGKRAVTFIPEVVSTAADILQAVFGKETRNATSRIQKDLRVSVTEAAMRMCTTVLDRTPKFFGRLTLNRIASLAVSVEREDINVLLVEAMTKVPANVSVGALVYVTANFAKFSATLTGVSTLLRGMSALTGVISKVELKPQKDRLTLALLSCIEYGRLGNTSPASVQENEMDTQSAARKCSTVELFNELVAIRGPEGFLSSCKKVDNGCADNFTRMVLRLSESDFKIIFNRVVQWLEGGRVMGGADRSNAIDMPQYLSRAVPILQISLKLMHVLRAIFVPYFLQLLDLVLEVLSSTSSKSSLDVTVELDADERKDLKSKKRKREKWEGSGEDAVRQVSSQLHRELYGLALESLTLLLREDLTGNILTPTLVTKIQTSLVVACGNGGKSEAVRKAVNALGTRIVAVGNMKESKEECREQLIAMSRAILSLAGGTDAVVREASMYYCKCLASTIGEEYLVTLPEAMPVLAELIDDEKDAVRRETSSFVKVMEALSGESIMEDMKS